MSQSTEVERELLEGECLESQPREPAAEVEEDLAAEKDAIKIYLNGLRKTRLLSAEEERDLGLRVQAGDQEARDRMVECNLRLVVKIAKRYLNRGLPFLEPVRRDARENPTDRKQGSRKNTGTDACQGVPEETGRPEFPPGRLDFISDSFADISWSYTPLLARPVPIS